MNKKKVAMFFAILAAALYAVNAPLSKMLLGKISPTMLAGFLYLGAGVGIGMLMLTRKVCKCKRMDKYLDKKDFPYTIAMVLLDIAAPIFLMYGMANTTSANVSLLNNFEIVATSIIALFVFKEKISKRLWSAIILVTVASMILGFEGTEAFVFNKGSIFVLCACICWGIENNCTRSISDKSSEEIVLIKGIFSGMGSVIVALLMGEHFPTIYFIAMAMLLGFVAYGLSINFYISAQKALGAAKTSAFYSITPFLGVGFSFVILQEKPLLQFYVALVIMAVSTLIMVKDTLAGDEAEKWHFGMTEAMANELLELVKSGKKTATSSSLWAYELEGEELPKAGEMSIITDWNGKAGCVVKTTRVRIIPFCEMTYEIAKLEGEDDTLASWQKKHIAFFAEEGKKVGYTFAENMPIVFEEFEIVEYL